MTSNGPRRSEFERPGTVPGPSTPRDGSGQAASWTVSSFGLASIRVTDFYGAVARVLTRSPAAGTFWSRPFIVCTRGPQSVPERRVAGLSVAP
jgi:hypothetical protein